MTWLRGVWPRAECAARSSGPRYASTSTSRPVRRRPATSRTRTLPSRSRATSSVSRSKNSRGRIFSMKGKASRRPASRSAGLALAQGTELGGSSPAGAVAPLLPVEELVGSLEEGPIVQAGPPFGQAEADLEVTGQSPADPVGDLSRMAESGIRHGDAELVTAQPRRHVGGADDTSDHVRHRPDRLVAGVMAVAVVDRLETVHVHQHQGQRAAVPGGQGQGTPDLALELTSVGEPGQVVGMRFAEVGEAVLECQRDMVANRPDEAHLDVGEAALVAAQDDEHPAERATLAEGHDQRALVGPEQPVLHL